MFESFKPESGMSMMLKKIGIDPTQITTQVANVEKIIVDFNQRMFRVEKKLDVLIAALQSEDSENGNTESSGDGNSSGGNGTNGCSDPS